MPALAIVCVLALAACTTSSQTGTPTTASSSNTMPVTVVTPSTSMTGHPPATSKPASVSSPHAAPRTGLPVGPGPQPHYAAQAQPAPDACHYRHTASGQPLPDAGCTPGATNPAVTQATLAATICRSGYTSSIRPPASVTDKEKVANADSYGYTGSLSQAEYDHLISLEIGGDPNSPKNLWVEPPSPDHLASQGVSNPKDAVENKLNYLVCNYVHLRSHNAGSATSYLPLVRAQTLIATNWTTALAKAAQSMVFA